MNDIDRSLSRFLEDLRSGAERRSWEDRRSEERREVPRPIVQDRRLQPDRRATDRRMESERRSVRFFRFTERETIEIHEMLADPRALVACPRCGAQLLRATPQTERGWDVTCLGCRGRLRLDPSAGGLAAPDPRA